LRSSACSAANVDASIFCLASMSSFVPRNDEKDAVSYSLKPHDSQKLEHELTSMSL
jgi:viroplasmin and RNaseH domain-containing protein